MRLGAPANANANAVRIAGFGGWLERKVGDQTGQPLPQSDRFDFALNYCIN
jgi:hypothetical protein